MKVRIEIDDDLEQTEIVIRTKQLSPEIETLLFFETDGSKVLAHTKDKTYDVKRKLYELEEYLPAYFFAVLPNQPLSM